MEEYKKDFLALEGKVVDAIKRVDDPDLSINIYDMGLIYEIKVEDSSEVYIKMTLTNANCPHAGSIIKDVREKVEEIEEVTAAYVKLVFDPPWTKDRMSEEARLESGLL